MPHWYPNNKERRNNANHLPSDPHDRTLELAKYFLQTYGFNHHQVSSYNYFAEHSVNEVFRGFDPIQCSDNIYATCSDASPTDEMVIVVYLKDVSTSISTLEPSECISRLVDYNTELRGTIHVEVSVSGTLLWKEDITDWLLGRIPVMTLSKFCKVGSQLTQCNNREEREWLLTKHRLDCSEIGGIFIAKGAEKVVVSQERLNNSSVYVFPPDEKELLASITADQTLIAECRSQNVKRSKQEMFSLTLSQPTNRETYVIRVTLPKFKRDFPLFIMLRAMLPISDEAGLSAQHTIFHTCEELAKILSMFSPRGSHPEVIDSLTRALEGSWLEAYDYWTPQNCLYYIGQRCSLPEEKKERELVRSLNIQNTILKEIFPHVYDTEILNVHTDLPPKLHFVMYQIYRLLAVFLRWEGMDDRDHYAIKRIDTTGALMRNFYRQLMVRQVKELQKQVVLACKKELRTGGKTYTIQGLSDKLRGMLVAQQFTIWWTPVAVEKEFSYALSTGNWTKNTYASASASSVVNKSVSQHFKRTNFVSQVAELRRVNLPVSQNSTNTRPRHVHPSQWAVVCSHETPEDDTVGFLKNMALALVVSPPIDPDNLLSPLQNLILKHDKQSNQTEALENLTGLTWVMLNGNIIGSVPIDNSVFLLLDIRATLKQGKHCMIGVSLTRQKRLLLVQTDEGRCCRLVMRIDKLSEWLFNPDLKAFPPISRMVENQWLEWTDVFESGQFAIAANLKHYQSLPDCLREKYTMCEIHPMMIAGYAASQIPYANQNQAPRVAYAAAMGRQASGAYATNMDERFDSQFDNLNYPQKSLTQTAAAVESYANSLPTIQNAVVAILSCGGENQEDAVVLSRHAVDMGMFRSTRYRTIKDHETTQKPPDTSTYQVSQHHRFDGDHPLVKPDSVDKDGLVAPGTRVEEGDVLMHKVIETKKTAIHWKTKAEMLAEASGKIVKSKKAVASRAKKVTTTVRRKKKELKEPTDEEKSSSVGDIEDDEEDVAEKVYGDVLESAMKIDPGNQMNAVKFHDPAIVDKVLVTSTRINGQGKGSDEDMAASNEMQVKIRLRSERIPVIGDKLASRGPQKGVIGQIRSKEDMPFTADGITPDLMLVPHSLPSRMTIAQMTSLVAGIVGCMEGRIMDATSFNDSEVGVVEFLSQLMVKHGFTPYGSHVMYDGATGEQLEGLVFMGVCDYQRMKQQVIDKYHVRARGQVQLVSRQPTEGKATSGGLRLGEMERDCTIGTSVINLRFVSVQMDSLARMAPTDVMSFSEITKNVEMDRVIAFLDKGVRPCVKIWLHDGRTLECTPEHKFLCEDSVWREAKNLAGHFIIRGQELPKVDLEAEILLCRSTNFLTYEKLCARSRLLGMLLTDGHSAKTGRSKLYFSHEWDISQAQYDIGILIGQEATITKQAENNFTLTLPTELTEILRKFAPDLLVGGRTSQDASWPESVLDEDFPLPLLREFVGALFGGDGHAPALCLHREKRDLITSVCFSQSRDEPFVDSLRQYLEDLKDMLVRLGLHSEHITVRAGEGETSASKARQANGSDRMRMFQLTLHIDIAGIEDFHRFVGFRYSGHKSQRLEAAVSYFRLRSAVARQCNWVVNRVRELKTSGLKPSPAVARAHKELLEREPAYNAHYSLPSVEMVRDRLKTPRQSDTIKMQHQHFPMAEQYLQSIGALDWFLDYGLTAASVGLPVMRAQVLRVSPIGEQPVYDIEVEKNHNFFANGIVAHNCIITQGMGNFLKEKFLYDSDGDIMNVCKQCGFLTKLRCPAHPNSEMATVALPWACHLMSQELMAMSIGMRFRVEDIPTFERTGA